jgi:hypothetical protein
MATCGECLWSHNGWCRRSVWGFLSADQLACIGDVRSGDPACPAFVGAEKESEKCDCGFDAQKGGDA